ncbi:uncharacterized protein BKA78DRAFT_158436 [Phyllosticta capitalensis]|uniref:uncharacterized protein n=1 Tax=Phyllosticta capitalensis TaxID=121624 RepID=UPI003130D55E
MLAWTVKISTTYLSFCLRSVVPFYVWSSASPILSHPNFPHSTTQPLAKMQRPAITQSNAAQPTHTSSVAMAAKRSSTQPSSHGQERSGSSCRSQDKTSDAPTYTTYSKYLLRFVPRTESCDGSLLGLGEGQSAAMMTLRKNGQQTNRIGQVVGSDSGEPIHRAPAPWSYCCRFSILAEERHECTLMFSVAVCSCLQGRTDLTTCHAVGHPLCFSGRVVVYMHWVR